MVMWLPSWAAPHRFGALTGHSQQSCSVACGGPDRGAVEAGHRTRLGLRPSPAAWVSSYRWEAATAGSCIDTLDWRDRSSKIENRAGGSAPAGMVAS